MLIQFDSVCTTMDLKLKTLNYDIYEDVLLSELRRRLPGKPATSTLRRWSEQGSTTRSGMIAYLDTIKLPGGLGSSIARYQEFLDELQK